MIVTEYFKTRKDGVVLNRTYSDEGFYIERDGEQYAEAIDPADSGRVYTETEELIPVVELSETEAKATAYDILVGGANNE